MPPERPLLMIVERFLRETGMPASKLGRRALNDPSFVTDLRRGRTPGTPLRCRVEHFMNTIRSQQQEVR